MLRVPLQKMLHFLLRSWEDLATISLIMERESLAVMIVAITITLFLAPVRFPQWRFACSGL
jgi:membrane protein YdbS with pleckstrin-like domain